ncbi:shikimate dehydrogenase [Nocardia macrotermitis]|uniref:Shikimate dehydrogenase (NADP(+)) n=1 Tax=Nocardia macrotermitis TaxID=2585198 RepID=A0A7K0DAH5_9NOCA|nr:shikimate dehydrogenase [Nocardia macrotermitis]MQY22599.1 Quinate/shikimate dehydrogenase (NAD(+)) [Nocardia macrotermitis]
MSSLLCGLIGTGIGASLSPSLHMAEGRHHGLDYRYRILDLVELGLGVEDLPALFERVRGEGYRGLNITHPCKQRIIGLLDELSPEASRLGAVNTVLFDGDRAIGHNTDWSGFRRSLDRGLPDVRVERVVQLGAGGAGAAVGYATLDRGARDLTIVDADPVRAGQLVETLGTHFTDRRVSVGSPDRLARLLADADGLVHATPMGMAEHPGMALPAELLRPDLWVAEVVYRPVETELVRTARAAGARVLTGTGMTLYQAVAAFEIFTGIAPDVERMAAYMDTLLAREALAAK